MAKSRSTARAVALWVLSLCVFFGPAGLGGTTALGGVPCACDDELEHASEHELDPCDADADADGLHEDPSPGKDECPDGCPDCGCCLGIAMAILPPSPTAHPPSRSRTVALPSTRMHASDTGSCIFRPPRSRV